jgi:phage terminase large subunit-like protein
MTSILVDTKPKRTRAKPKLIGAVEPRLHTPYLKGPSVSHEVEALAEKLGITLMPWQKFVLADMMKVDKSGNYRRKSNLLLISRQQGKTFLACLLIIYNLTQGKRCIAMSSNRSMALDTFRNVVYLIESNDELSAMLKGKPRLANGQERILFKNNGSYEIVAATRDGARGRNCDYLFLDEVRELNQEAFSAATPLTRAHPNAQTLMTSNAGDAFSTVLNSLREKALSYPPETFGFYEYSADPFCKIDDVNQWAKANPALGHTVTLETLTEAYSVNSVEQWKTESLCLWIDSLQSPWPHGILEATGDSEIKFAADGRLTIFAFDVALSRRSASLVCGQLLEDGRVAVGILKTWEAQGSDVDNLRIAADIKEKCDAYRPQLVCYDKYATASIADRLANAGVMVQDISGANFYTACGDLLDGLVNNRVVHANQELWVNHMNNCAAKTNDSAWRIIKRKSAGPIDAAIGTAMVVHQLIKPQSTPAIISI